MDILNDIVTGIADKVISQKELMLSDDRAVCEYILNLNYRGIECPHCHSRYRPVMRKSKIKKSPVNFNCKCTNSTFSIQASTPLRNTKIRMGKWLKALDLSSDVTVSEISHKLDLKFDSATNVYKILRSLEILRRDELSNKLSKELNDLDKVAVELTNIAHKYVAAKKFLLLANALLKNNPDFNGHGIN